MMALTPAQRITALEDECTNVIRQALEGGGDEEALYQAQVNFQQGLMWLRHTVCPPPAAYEPPAEPELDRTPPDERARVVYPRTHGGVDYWWRWRDKQWVPFSELPEESQVCAMGNGYTVG